MQGPWEQAPEEAPSQEAEPRGKEPKAATTAMHIVTRRQEKADGDPLPVMLELLEVDSGGASEGEETPEEGQEGLAGAKEPSWEDALPGPLLPIGESG